MINLFSTSGLGKTLRDTVQDETAETGVTVSLWGGE